MAHVFVFEGIDGAGKSSALERCAAKLGDAVYTRSFPSERVRASTRHLRSLGAPAADVARVYVAEMREALALAPARALALGCEDDVVFYDRWALSTFAYSPGLCCVEAVALLTAPTAYFYFVVPADVAVARQVARGACDVSFGEGDVAAMQRLLAEYDRVLAVAEAQGATVYYIDATRSREEIDATILSIVEAYVGGYEL